MSLAAAGLGQSRADDAFQGVLAGAALMMLAAFSPLALLRLIPLAESAAHTNWRSGAGSQTLGPIAGPAAVMRRVTDANWGGAMRRRAARGARGARSQARAAWAQPAPRPGRRSMSAGVRTGAATAAGMPPQPAERRSDRPENPRYATPGGSGHAARPERPASANAPAPGSGSLTPAPARRGAARPAGDRRPTGQAAARPRRTAARLGRLVAADARRYRFGPLEQRGIVGGLRTGQVTVCRSALARHRPAAGLAASAGAWSSPLLPL